MMNSTFFEFINIGRRNPILNLPVTCLFFSFYQFQFMNGTHFGAPNAANLTGAPLYWAALVIILLFYGTGFTD